MLETTRLRLREQGAGDLDVATEFWARPDVYRHIDGRPRPREEVWRRILANAGNWALLGYGSWAVETRADGRYVGSFGFLSAEREMVPPFAPDEIETGWGLDPDVHGQGYALEALSAALAWADAALKGRPLVCIIDEANAASRKLAAKTGFRERGRAIYRDAEVIQLVRTIRA